MKFSVALLLIGLSLTACTTESEETVNIQIINDLDNSVRMELYERGFPSGIESIELNGKGILFEGSDTARLVVLNQILEADSVVFIFDNQRLEYHLLRENTPVGNSIFEQDSYINEEGVFKYILDSNNLNNAISCDGPCR